MSKYAWLITEDHLAKPNAKPGTNMNAVGICGPYNATDEQCAELEEGAGKEFKMYDDDGNLYYTGRILGGCGMEPLNDYGTPNAGAVRIELEGEPV